MYKSIVYSSITTLERGSILNGTQEVSVQIFYIDSIIESPEFPPTLSSCNQSSRLQKNKSGISLLLHRLLAKHPYN